VTGDGAFLLSAVDVTEARDQQHRLASALDAARAADLSKSQFLATMSHEMRTPLNGVLGMASILGSSDLTEAQRRALDIIASSGGHMLEMIEDMLDIVALDARALELHPAPYDPALLLRAAVEAERADAERKGLSIRVETDRVRPGVYIHDASRLRQVLGHLLSNAVKFTDSGTVTARVRSDLDEAGLPRLRFEVCDTGPGVPEAERSRIFERFHQLDASATRRHGGTGLGLAICRELASLWNGTIGVSGGEGGGSVFWFEAPCCWSACEASAQRTGSS
jgi:signal transduction histidine kinase